MNVFHHARLQIKKMDKVDSKNINGCWVCGLHIKKKPTTLFLLNVSQC